MPTVARLLLSAALVAAAAAPAAAFDCGKAVTKVETAICADPDLMAKDDAMSKAYGAAKALSTDAERKMLARAQKRWIVDRESACEEMTGAELAGCIGDLADRRRAMFEGTPESGPGTESRLLPVFVFKDGGPGSYDVAFSLFRFVDPASEGERLFNRKAAEIAAMAPVDQTVDGMDRELSSVTDMALTHVSPTLLSVLVSFWSDDGGAHGNGGTDNINIDMRSGRDIAIDMVLGEDAAADLAQQCRDQIVAQKSERLEGETYDPAADDFLKDEVIAEHIATMSRWSLAEDEATVSFDAYAVGPYAEGSYGCTFAMDALKRLAKPGAPLP